MLRSGDMAFEWFERDDYPSILGVMEDTHRLPPTFEEWEKNAEAGVRALEAAGHVIVPTLIKPDIFVEWCRANGLKPDARARLKFCNTKHNQSSHSGVECESAAPSSPTEAGFAAAPGQGAEAGGISMPPPSDLAAKAKPGSEPQSTINRVAQWIGVIQIRLRRLVSDRRH